MGERRGGSAYEEQNVEVECRPRSRWVSLSFVTEATVRFERNSPHTYPQTTPSSRHHRVHDENASDALIPLPLRFLCDCISIVGRMGMGWMTAAGTRRLFRQEARVSFAFHPLG